MMWRDVRNVLKGAAILAACLVTAFVMRALVPLPFPVALWAMVAVFCLCVVLGQVPPSLRMVGEFLLRHLPLFFIPAVVGVLRYGDLLKTDGLIILVALVVSTALGLVVTAGVFQWVSQRQNASGALEELK